MGWPFTDSNDEGSNMLFNKRILYMAESGTPQGETIATSTALTDFLAEKRLYGRVSRHFVPIEANPTNPRIWKGLGQTAQASDQKMAFNFVVDAFNAMAIQFRKCVAMGKIRADDPWLSTLTVYKAHQSPVTLYKDYLRSYREIFRANANATPGHQIENFDIFEQRLLESVHLTGHEAPLTYPAFLKNRRCPITVSGLVIEIADLDPSNDEEKYNQFLKSKNWDFFANAAATYGFMIDKNIPWRLVADIGSSAMLEYAAQYGATTTNMVLALYYKSPIDTYQANFHTHMLDMYEQSTVPVLHYAQQCGSRVVARQTAPTHYSSPTDLKNAYEDYHFLELYANIRFEEEEVEFSELRRHELIDSLKEMATRGHVNLGVRRFEKIINKPFDYQGSLGYYREMTKLSEAAQKQIDTFNEKTVNDPTPGPWDGTD